MYAGYHIQMLIVESCKQVLHIIEQRIIICFKLAYDRLGFKAYPLP